MTKRQAAGLKLVAYLLALLLIWALTFAIESALAQAQPPTRDVEWLLTPDGRVFGGRDEGLILQLGAWSGQSLGTNRGVRGRVRVIRIVAAGGEDILLAYSVPPPARTSEAEGFPMTAMEFPGSLWIPLSGEAWGWELDGARLRVALRVYVRQ